MSLLAKSANTGNVITVVILCIAIVVFLLVNVILVFSLHKSNKRLVKRKELREPEAITENTDVKENGD